MSKSSKNTAWTTALVTAMQDNRDDFEVYISVMKDMQHQFGDPIGCGSYRVVFDTMDGFIAKVPLNPEGMRDNQIEAELFAKHPLSNYAKCALKRMGELDVLVMEKLEHLISTPSGIAPAQVYDPTALDPYWVTKINGSQIGVDKDGHLRAYDFSKDLGGKEEESQS